MKRVSSIWKGSVHEIPSAVSQMIYAPAVQNWRERYCSVINVVNGHTVKLVIVIIL